MYFDKNLKDWKKFVLPNLRNPNLKDPFYYIKNKQDRNLIYENDFDIKQYSNLPVNSTFEEKNYSKELLRDRMMNELFHEVVPAILKHDDLNSMFYSIENRSPYLDRDLLEFSSTIPSSYLIENGYQKKILREVTSNMLNDKIRLDRRKKGFNASINSLLNLNNPEIIDYIFNEKTELAEFINLKKVKKDLDMKFIPNHLSKFIFSLLGTKIFLENN